MSTIENTGTHATDTAPCPLAQATLDVLGLVMNYARKLAEDIPAEKFGHMPHPTMNHPAFCYGHLSLYPNYLLEMLGRKDLIVEKEGWHDLFEAPAPCVEQDGRYPSKDEILEFFNDRHEVIAAVLREVREDVLDEPHDGYFKGKIATNGGVVNFTLTSHTMMHLGQVSAWRRAVDLPSVL